MRKIKEHMMILPFTIYMVLFFMFSIFYLLFASLGDKKDRFIYYRNILKNEDFYCFLRYTTKINIITIIIIIIITIFLLYLIYKNNLNRYIEIELFNKIISFPILIPYISCAYGITLLLLKLPTLLGIDFKKFINDELGVGIILAYVWKITPFMLFITIPILTKASKKWEKLRLIYNISEWEYFKGVILPLILPSLNIGIFLVSTYLYSSYEVPYILGVSYPKTLMVWIMERYKKEFFYSQAEIMALNCILGAISLLFSYFVCFIIKIIFRIEKREW